MIQYIWVVWQDSLPVQRDGSDLPKDLGKPWRIVASYHPHFTILPRDPLKGNLIFIFFFRNWMQSLKRCFFPVSPCTKYITHSCRGDISSAVSSSVVHSFPWHRFLKFRDTPLQRNRPLSQKSLSGKFGSVGVETYVVHESNHVFSF